MTWKLLTTIPAAAGIVAAIWLVGDWKAGADQAHKKARENAERLNVLSEEKGKRDVLRELCAKGDVKVERCPADFEHPERRR